MKLTDGLSGLSHILRDNYPGQERDPRLAWATLTVPRPVFDRLCFELLQVRRLTSPEGLDMPMLEIVIGVISITPERPDAPTH